MSAEIMSPAGAASNTLERRQYDVIVIGSGGAGAAAAHTAATQGARVLVVSKDPIVCSDSKIAEGIVTVRASGSSADTEQALSSNLRLGGDDIADPQLTRAFASDSIDSYTWLREQGIKPRIDQETGKPVGVPTAMGGHSLPRSIDHENGGLDYAHACWNALMQRGDIEYLEDAWFLDVVKYSVNDEDRIGGGLIYHAAEGKLISVKASSVVIACGGLSTMYFPHTDTMRGNTGDSYAIAARAGAHLVDMEQIQFIPFAIADPGSYEGLVVGEPVSAGVLGVIRDRDGNCIKSELMVRTRAECAAAIAIAVADGRGTENGGCYLDLTANAKGQSGAVFKDLMDDRLAGILKTVKGALGGPAAAFAEPWEVKPSAHYCMGGVRASENGEVLDSKGAIIAGLFVAGQALGGLHGSNRLGSTSLAEGIIFGRRAGETAAQYASDHQHPGWGDIEQHEREIALYYTQFLGRSGAQYPIHLIRELQASCWQGLGPARTAEGIERALAVIKRVESQLATSTVAVGLAWNQGLINVIECRNMLLCAEQVAQAALLRNQSLGAHVRLDTRSGHAGKGNFSTACHLDDKAQVQITMLERESSSSSEKVTMALRQNAKMGLMKVLNRMPHRWRDPVLLKIYSKALGKPAGTVQTGATS